MLLRNNLEAQDTILGQIHVTFEQSGGRRTTSVHCLSLEVRCERSLAVREVLECFVAVRAEGTWKDTDVAKYALRDYTSRSA